MSTTMYISQTSNLTQKSSQSVTINTGGSSFQDRLRLWNARDVQADSRHLDVAIYGRSHKCTGPQKQNPDEKSYPKSRSFKKKNNNPCSSLPSKDATEGVASKIAIFSEKKTSYPGPGWKAAKSPKMAQKKIVRTETFPLTKNSGGNSKPMNFANFERASTTKDQHIDESQKSEDVPKVERTHASEEAASQDLFSSTETTTSLDHTHDQFSIFSLDIFSLDEAGASQKSKDNDQHFDASEISNDDSKLPTLTHKKGITGMSDKHFDILKKPSMEQNKSEPILARNCDRPSFLRIFPKMLKRLKLARKHKEVVSSSDDWLLMLGSTSSEFSV